MLKLFFWLRYLRKKKIVSLSIAAVALSAALLIVVASLFNGFIGAFEQSAVEAMGDIVLTPPIRFAEYPLFIRRLEQVRQVKAATATLFAPGLLHLGKGNVRAVEIWGIEPDSRARVTNFKPFLLRQKNSANEPSFEVSDFPDRTGGFVGIGVVTEPNEKTDEYDFQSAGKMIGQQAVLTTGMVSQAGAGKDKEFRRRTVEFTISDIVFTGVYEVDKMSVYLPIEKLQKVLYPDQAGQIAQQVQIKLTDDSQADVALAQIRGMWADFAAGELGWGQNLIAETAIETSKQMQSSYTAEFRKQMGVLLLIFGAISLSAVLLIFCIFYMIAVTRQKDIAILKSCGTSNGAVAMIFIGFGGCVGVIGSAAGAAMGYVITKNINAIEEWIRIIFGLKLWKSSVYMFSRIPNEVDWNAALFIVLSAIVAAAVGALIPAFIAVRTRPVNILRYE